MRRHRDGLFPEVPVIHLAVDQSYLRSTPPLPEGIVGVPVEFDFGGTIQQALQWHSGARRLVVVTGSSARDLIWHTQIREEVARLGIRLPVEFLSGLPTDALKARLHALTKEEVVFTPGYFRDGAGREFSPREAAALGLPASMPSVPQLDWRQARRWGIADADIPPDAVVHFREPTSGKRTAASC